MAIKTQIYKTQTEEETFRLGQELSDILKPGDSISLEGDLGTGKTAITKGIAYGLGITEPITSPTFTLVNTYEGRTTLHHFDVYRVDDPDEMFAIGWEEYFCDDAITIVEWGNLVRDILPPHTMRILLTRDDKNPDGRIITLERQVV
jgi:tRNA threonylcarbamoyladenosine biosynthesis protein TsaE